MKTYDVVVIGGGPGGHTAAVRAAQMGGSVCLVEKAELGGTCTNRGCIPTKVLARCAHTMITVRRAAELGIAVASAPRLDFGRVAQRRDAVVATLRDGIGKLLKAHAIDVLTGVGRLIGPHRVTVTDGTETELTARSIIVATGSIPAGLPTLPVDGRRVVTSDELLADDTLPRSLVVVGGGIIGCEFASIYRTMGVEITIVELLDRLLPNMDPTFGKILQRSFKKAGIRVLTKTSVQGVAPSSAGTSITLGNGEQLEVERVLVSVGRSANTRGIGLEESGVKLERGMIQVDEHLYTGVDGIYAVGDAVGKTWLAHTASREGEVAAACALGESATMRYNVVPAVVFTDPELASVGLMAKAATERGIAVDEGVFHYGASGKALCDGIGDGRVEIVAARDNGKIIGGLVVGEHAGILIAEIAVAIDRGLTARELSEVIHAHPTLPEMIREASADTYGRAINRAPGRHP
jgi:dihydrolipoamide dehydrogenase